MSTDGRAIGALECETLIHPDQTTVVARGEIDMATAPRLHDALEAAADSGLGVILDLREVTFMDSSGIDALVDAQARLRRGQALLVVGATPHMRRLFELTGVGALAGVDDQPSRPRSTSRS